jgi:integrase
MYALNPLLDIYGGIDAQDFNPTHLDGYVEAQKDDDVSRQTINKRIGIIKRMLKWAKNKRVTRAPHPYDECRDFEGAKAGKGFREAPRIPAVPQTIVDATLPHLPPTVQTMIKLQIHGRMRPEEVCSLRLCDIDRTQSPWLYRPVWHKNLHRGQERRIFLGAECQALLTPYLDGAADAPVFSPRAAVGERRGKLPRKRIGACYDTRSYRKAIWYACDKAGLARWSPNRLRKLGLDMVEKALGKQAAKAAAGHSRVETTQDYYLSGNDAAARAVAEAMG